MNRALLLCLVLAGSAHAAPAPDAPPPPSDSGPWAKGVSAEQQRKANVVFAAGNELFAAHDYGPALEKYRASLAMWDHPLVRFNMAVTLIRLDRILDAADALDGALRYGATPFTPELYQQALDYQALVKGRVGQVEVDCNQVGTHVVLDGKPWFACPGTHNQRVMAGEHIVVGQHDGFASANRRVVVNGGATATQTVDLIPLDRAVSLTYPVARWLPWSITGTGAALALSGLGVWFAGRSQMDRFESNFGIACPTGCPLAAQPELADEHHSAQLKGKIGIGMFVAGGVTIASGIVMTLLDHPHRVLTNLEIAPNRQGVTATIGWPF